MVVDGSVWIDRESQLFAVTVVNLGGFLFIGGIGFGNRVIVRIGLFVSLGEIAGIEQQTVCHRDLLIGIDQIAAGVQRVFGVVFVHIDTVSAEGVDHIVGKIGDIAVFRVIIRGNGLISLYDFVVLIEQRVEFESVAVVIAESLRVQREKIEMLKHCRRIGSAHETDTDGFDVVKGVVDEILGDVDITDVVVLNDGVADISLAYENDRRVSFLVAVESGQNHVLVVTLFQSGFGVGIHSGDFIRIACPVYFVVDLVLKFILSDLVEVICQQVLIDHEQKLLKTVGLLDRLEHLFVGDCVDDVSVTVQFLVEDIIRIVNSRRVGVTRRKSQDDGSQHNCDQNGKDDDDSFGHCTFHCGTLLG